MSQESKTPRTDAELFPERFEVGDSLRFEVVPADFARQLERELAAVTEERDAFIASARIKEANSGWRTIETVDDGLVLLCTAYGSVHIGSGQFVFALLADAARNGESCVYCGWMPLPAPPTKDAEQ